MIRIGLAGSKKHIISHLEIFAKIPGIQISGYCDEFHSFQENILPFGAEYCATADELIKHSDAVVYVTGEHRYYKTALQSLKESKHIFLSHGIVENKSQSQQLIKLAGEANVILMVERPGRYHAALASVMPHLKNIRLIELHTQFVSQNGHSYENLFRAVINDLDIIHTVLHSNVKNVKACGIKMVNGNPDVINVRLEFDNGSVANLNCSRVTPENVHFGMFTQQDRITKIDFLSNEVMVIKPEKRSGQLNGDYDLNPVVRKVVPNNPLMDEYLNFIYSINNNSKLLSNREEQFKSLYITERIMDCLGKVISD